MMLRLILGAKIVRIVINVGWLAVACYVGFQTAQIAVAAKEFVDYVSR